MTLNREMTCKAPSCTNSVYASGFCNGHYLRHRRGINLDAPIRRQERDRKCKIDGCDKKHYGNDLCSSHWKRWSRHSIKKQLIQKMGGKCVACGGMFHPAAFDFHHLDPSKKDFSLTNAFNNKTLDDIFDEAKKCILLCANCHRVEHAGEQYA